MGEGCKEAGSSWEEQIYWNKFKFIHFFQYLHAGYHQELGIPQEFARNLKKKLVAETVHLKGPSGLTWTVGIKEKDDTLFFNSGWPEFVEHHSSSLRENDVLFFKYIGDSSFDVLVLDGQSRCENVALYFVKKCGHTRNTDTGCQTKRTRESSQEDISSSKHQSDEDYSPENVVDNNTNRRSIRAHNVSTSSRKRILRGNSSVKPACGGPSLRRKAKATRRDTTDEVRRRVTEDGKRRALRLGEAAVTPGSLLIIMKPSHVHNLFILAIPSEWMKTHLTLKDQDVILQSDNKLWEVKFKVIRKRYGRFVGGWKKFSSENNLEEFDVCVFKPVNLATKPIMLDVTIFRAVN